MVLPPHQILYIIMVCNQPPVYPPPHQRYPCQFRRYTAVSHHCFMPRPPLWWPNLLQVGSDKQNYAIKSFQNHSYQPNTDTIMQGFLPLLTLWAHWNSPSFEAISTTTDVVMDKFINYPDSPPLVSNLQESTPSSAPVALGLVATRPGMLTGGQMAPSQKLSKSTDEELDL